MNQNSTRILLGVGALALIAGTAFYFVKAGDLAAKRASHAASGNPAAPLAVPAIPARGAAWAKPVLAEGDLWTYDLFTPVEVSWNAGANEYEPKGLPPVNVGPFGLKLASLKHPTYRYRISGIFAGKTPAETLVKLTDVETGASVSGKIGQTVGADDAKITIVNYEDKGVKQPDGSIVKVTYVLVNDAKLGREIKVTRDVLSFDDKLVATLVDPETGRPVWTVSAVGDKYEDGGSSFVIKGIDFNGQSVTVEKTLPEDPVRKTRATLVETLFATPAESASPAAN